MITLDQIYDRAVWPALALLPKQMTSPQATVMLLATTRQESPHGDLWQIIDVKRPDLKGPARGLWQFERGNKLTRGGVTGVMMHAASRYWLHELCQQFGVPFTSIGIWAALEGNNQLAAGLARLLLFTDRSFLPSVNDMEAGWLCYKRVWGPGKPDPARWPANHAAAREFVAKRMDAGNADQ